jgi:ABC-type branched-subunit amino acid transport system ATPase component
VIDRGRIVFGGSPDDFERDPEIARRYLMVVE